MSTHKTRNQTYGVRYSNGMILPATHREQAERVAAEDERRSVVVIFDVALYEDDQEGLGNGT